jgi:alpha-amylase
MHLQSSRSNSCPFVGNIETRPTLPQEAVRYKKYHFLADKQSQPHGLIGLRPEAAVTFVDNHDTGSTQRHWPFPRVKKLEGYAYVLTHPGIPAVFWEHLYEDSADLASGIRTLIAMRKRAGVTAVSKVVILNAEPEQYVADVYGTDALVRVRLGPMEKMGKHEPTAVDGWGTVLKGSDFCVWTRSGLPCSA